MSKPWEKDIGKGRITVMGIVLMEEKRRYDEWLRLLGNVAINHRSGAFCSFLNAMDRVKDAFDLAIEAAQELDREGSDNGHD